MNILSRIQAFISRLKVNAGGSQHCRQAVKKNVPSCYDELIATMVIFIIIDRSGSMEDADYPPSRLQAAKEAAIEYIKTLIEGNVNAKICIITFGDEATVVAKPTSITCQKQIIEKIQSIEIGGGTDINKGLKKAMNILSGFSSTGFQSQIVLLTDGHGGDPITTAGKLKQQYNAIIDVVGIGGCEKSVNTALLKKVATTDPDGTSHYRFIKDTATLKKHYHQLATGVVWKGGDQ